MNIRLLTKIRAQELALLNHWFRLHANGQALTLPVLSAELKNRNKMLTEAHEHPTWPSSGNPIVLESQINVIQFAIELLREVEQNEQS